MNTRTIYTTFWILGFGLIIFSAIYFYKNKAMANTAFYTGMALTTVAIIVRLKFLKRK